MCRSVSAVGGGLRRGDVRRSTRFFRRMIRRPRRAFLATRCGMSTCGRPASAIWFVPSSNAVSTPQRHQPRARSKAVGRSRSPRRRRPRSSSPTTRSMVSAIACACVLGVAGVRGLRGGCPRGGPREQPGQGVLRDDPAGPCIVLEDDLVVSLPWPLEWTMFRSVAEERLLEVADPDGPLLPDLEPVFGTPTCAGPRRWPTSPLRAGAARCRAGWPPGTRS